MKKYGSYKDSGIEWIGEIPSEWDFLKVRHTFFLKGRIGWQGLKADEFIDKGPYLVTGTDFQNGQVNWDTCYHISEERYNEAPEIHVKNGDVLITKDGTVGKMAFIENKPEKVSLNSHLLIVRPLLNSINNKYVYWAFQTSSFDYYKGLSQTGSIMESLSQEKIASFIMPYPSLQEQTAIANYLDDKCSKIDNVISTQQKRIELLKELKQSIITRAVTRGINPDAKMKDSGVEWIGEIPEHWEVQRIKHVVKQIGDVDHYMPKSVETGIPYVMTGDLQEMASLIDFDSCKQISDQDYLALSKKIKAENDDIIFARYATIGTTCYVDIEKEFIVSYSCVTIKPNKDKISGKYLIYYIKSNAFAEEVQSYINSNTQGNVGVESLNSTRLVVPPIEEQESIVTYIEQQTSKLDSSITKALRQIELLKEYKQSLITEVVTGKRKVC